MIDLKQYGYTETEPLPAGLIPGRVTEFRRNQYSVITMYGEVDAVLKGSFVHEAVVRADLPCVGDFVTLQYNERGASPIAGLLPRRSKFSRSDFSGHGFAHIKANREQVVAVNFDYVFIVTSLNRDFRVNRILRYLTQARAGKAEPVVILTKADLCEDFSVQVKEVREAAPDVAVHAISSHTGFGLDALEKYLQPGKTIVFLGMSGVGKSSLLNALAGGDIMSVRETRQEDSSKGAHTTTHRQLIMLPSGAMVIDTPGMRELGLYDAEESISEGFSDVEELFLQCRFKDCGHESEPGCAVQAAIKDGTLPHTRWEQYQTQKREDKYVEDKTAFMRERANEHKSWAKSNKAERRALKNNWQRRI
ncbi:MAG: ribosome small subunit-dependent GTPase A [Defluviitaleaceae bacterium]|nr:ribosome small subunit-dependent GTPase A [Defluviitaleaceae bacterium]